MVKVFRTRKSTSLPIRVLFVLRESVHQHTIVLVVLERGYLSEIYGPMWRGQVLDIGKQWAVWGPDAEQSHCASLDSPCVSNTFLSSSMILNRGLLALSGDVFGCHTGKVSLLLASASRAQGCYSTQYIPCNQEFYGSKCYRWETLI